ncbi:unnamed protein product [Somion occarium]|uniref:LysM domain-containing protein n=1 Tax=Somion occarium TaxID=3059160 RepID=A0ABP1CGS6_9APHY
MGRWTQYDEDDYRLPEGMKRVGYDADTGRYYYRDGAGSLWEGAEGAQYGELKQVSDTTTVDITSDDDLEAAPTRADGYQPLASDDMDPRRAVNNTHAYRTLFPFFLIILVVLLLVLRLVSHPSQSDEPDIVLCTGKARPYRVKKGDTCWDIAKREGCTLEELQNVNQDLECKRLTPSQIICLPEAKTA